MTTTSLIHPLMPKQYQDAQLIDIQQQIVAIPVLITKEVWQTYVITAPQPIIWLSEMLQCFIAASAKLTQRQVSFAVSLSKGLVTLQGEFALNTARHGIFVISLAAKQAWLADHDICLCATL